MTEYTYTFERLDEELAVTLVTKEPIPHIGIGSALNIVNDHLALPPDKVFIVRHIETLVSAIADPLLPRMRIQVWLDLESRPSFLPHR